MAEVVCIRNGDFQAHIQLDGLPKLPISRVKKLFRQLFLAKDQNTEAIYLLDRFLPKQIDDAKEQWRFASEAYQSGLKYIPNPKKRSEETRALMKHNALLSAAVKTTKSMYDRWEKVHLSYINIKGD